MAHGWTREVSGAGLTGRRRCCRAVQADDAGLAGGVSGRRRSLAQRAVLAAVELDLIDSDEVGAGLVQVQSMNPSSRVARVVCGDRAWIVKHAGGSVLPGNDWRAEIAAYRAAATVAEASLVPGLVGHSRDHDVLLIESLDRSWRRLDSFELRSPWSIEVVSRVATSLARWHHASRPLVGIAPAQVALFTDTAGLLDDKLADDSLRGTIRTVEDAWVASHVMHGDVGLTHVMCHDDGPVRFVDWRASGWGDPRWDLAGLLQELHSGELEHGFDTTAYRTAVLDSYAERVPSPSALSETDPTLRAFVACRLIWRAVQIHSSPQGTTSRVNAHLAAARALGHL